MQGMEGMLIVVPQVEGVQAMGAEKDVLLRTISLRRTRSDLHVRKVSFSTAAVLKAMELSKLLLKTSKQRYL